jgi:hypothetical protein
VGEGVTWRRAERSSTLKIGGLSAAATPTKCGGGAFEKNLLVRLLTFAFCLLTFAFSLSLGALAPRLVISPQFSHPVVRLARRFGDAEPVGALGYDAHGGLQ